MVEYRRKGTVTALLQPEGRRPLRYRLGKGYKMVQSSRQSGLQELHAKGAISPVRLCIAPGTSVRR
ncbi:MAG: hypothetical protein M1378_01925, partial [Bacteroidetes bacterium]|nr:hypothetical protein [Bacteroidota bacterium]